uniref:Putative mantle 4 n=1 Tax=Pinctada fucata TaxID=50426 RepID=A0A194AMC1_PINFU
MFRIEIFVMLTVMVVTIRGQICSFPEKVYFQAWNSATFTNIKSGHIFVFDRTNTNHGNHYDSSNGNFTAPRDGPYVFTWTVVTQDKYSINVELFRNNQRVSRAQADGQPGPQNSSGSNTVVLDLKTGDVVNLRCGGWMNQDQRQLYGDTYSTFSGWAL